MAWIRIIDEDEAEGPLAEIYAKVRKRRGRVADVYKLHSLHPQTMEHHLHWYMGLLYGRSPLSRRQREMIGTVTSAANRCTYCVTHHSEALAKYEKEPEKVRAVATDFKTAGLDAKDEAMCVYARKLTLAPWDVSEADVKALREAGCTDAEILDVNLITSYFNFVNRAVSGLGLELESEEDRVYTY